MLFLLNMKKSTLSVIEPSDSNFDFVTRLARANALWRSYEVSDYSKFLRKLMELPVKIKSPSSSVTIFVVNSISVGMSKSIQSVLDFWRIWPFTKSNRMNLGAIPNLRLPLQYISMLCGSGTLDLSMNSPIGHDVSNDFAKYLYMYVHV